MSLGAVLVTGLFAGGLSCAAVQGGLLAGVVTRQRAGQTPRVSAGAPAAAARLGVGGEEPATGATIPLGVASRSGGLTADLAPVAAFLGGKLLSHTALGALLGAVGSAVRLSPTVRTWTQLLAGVLIVLLALAQLGVPGFRRIRIEPPASWSRYVRLRARSDTALAPAVLGVFTVLIPCGVTLSVEAIALTTGSVAGGAATMAVFVLGTSPLFVLLGYAARKAATAWRGRFAAVVGVLVLVLGLYTINGGLTLADSPLAASNLPRTLGVGPAPAVADPSVVSIRPTGQQEVIVTATTDSFAPANIAVRAGVPTVLIIRAENAEGCIRSFVIPALNRDWILPRTGDTRIDLGRLTPGTLHYSCGMGMYRGQLTITPTGRS
ncbi:sulfite exporter TauE/SafE family protein [Cryptosporangium minutisporangium]|uniref:Sulfite exporter TauE/SafE n=1 Tax=Cryptosporangium minutisporangium TaxID=113569 RepID=A0ABP6T0V5_9ACTN